MSAKDNGGRDGHNGQSGHDEQAAHGRHDVEAELEDELEDDDDFDPAEYNTLIQLERLESLEEEMTDLGVSSLDDIRRRIEELNAQLDEERSAGS
jgi:hypothetical protein